MDHNNIALALSNLPSQTSLDERIGLYNLARNQFSGQGYIYDIGTAAGGSTFCLALGLDHSQIENAAKLKKIYGFDLFSGYSLTSFKDNPYAKQIIGRATKPIESDLDLFLAVTSDYKELIEPFKINLLSEFGRFRKPGLIEIAHIDAAKSLDLWKNILPVISEGVIPGVTTFVFQDFERCRLPWQWLFVAEMLERGLGQWVSVFDGGTVHLRILNEIPDALIEESILFGHGRDRAIALWAKMYDFIAQDEKMKAKFNGNFEDISKCTLAYIHFYQGRLDEAKDVASTVSQSFFNREPIYRNELNL